MSGIDAALIHEVKQLRELKQKLTDGVDDVQENSSAVLQNCQNKFNDVQSSVQTLESRVSEAMCHFNELKLSIATVAQQRTHVESQLRMLDSNIDAVTTQTRDCQDSLTNVLHALKASQTEYQMLVNRQSKLIKYRDSMR